MPPDAAELLSKALKFCVEIIDAVIGYLEVRNNKGDQLWSAYHCRESEGNTIRHEILTEIVDEVIHTGKAIVNSSSSINSSLDRSYCGKHENSMICTPFTSDECRGAICLLGEGGCGFNDSDIEETNFIIHNIIPLLGHLRDQIGTWSPENHIKGKFNINGIIGDSPSLHSVLKEAMAITDLDITVLITGETGTGKGMLSRAIHDNSPRKNKPYIHLNCANLPEQLVESELFGVHRGAHSSAYTNINGKIAAAEGGTLFLDEIGEIPVSVQSKLLQFLEDNCYYPLGATTPVTADVRIIVATNIDFKRSITNGTFREDLYYRLSTFPIEMPSLKKRKEDIPALTRYFVNKYCARFNMPILEIDPMAIIALTEREWNGNIRQLENYIQQGVLRSRFQHSSRLLFSHFFPDEKKPLFGETETYRQVKNYWEQKFIEGSLLKHNWNVTETAKALGLSRSHINNLISVYKLERGDLKVNSL
jgi:Nif-specific regulatory protein